MSPVDFRSVMQVIERVQPGEIYNLAGQSSVSLSFTQPAETLESIVLGTLNILEALRLVGRNVRLYNAGSSEAFGDTDGRPADETAAFRPKSPYGVAKAASVSLVANYREAYGLFACSGLLFNHESPLRPERFFTRKVARAAVQIGDGKRACVRLGRLSFSRDWGWAPDYVEAMAAMLRCQTATDLVVASGQAHALEEFVDLAFQEVGLNWREHVEFDPELDRPSDIHHSLGNASKAEKLLGWRSRIGFGEIVARMVRAEREGMAAGS
jgi:GDPmannose 4,6-dehydratase